MSIILANKDGTSNAKAGDVVVTGGGIFKKNADGTSSKVGALPTTNGTTGDYNVVVNTFREMTGSGSDVSISGTQTAGSGYTAPSSVVSNVDPNGVVSVAGYDPGDYATYSNTSSSSGMSNILGYVMLGLVGIALLDRFMSKGAK